MSVPVEAITRERLGRWARDCVRHHATPLVLVAVGHDERSGTVYVCRTEDGPSDAEIGALLRRVAQELMG
ncbi:MAG TPA: hypothetical protein VG370_34765 [Chloroflexota bacterium]|nr:hypothetical protein [Chloroflexota bacterium]